MDTSDPDDAERKRREDEAKRREKELAERRSALEGDEPFRRYGELERQNSAVQGGAVPGGAGSEEARADARKRYYQQADRDQLGSVGPELEPVQPRELNVREAAAQHASRQASEQAEAQRRQERLALRTAHEMREDALREETTPALTPKERDRARVEREQAKQKEGLAQDQEADIKAIKNIANLAVLQDVHREELQALEREQSAERSAMDAKWNTLDRGNHDDAMAREAAGSEREANKRYFECRRERRGLGAEACGVREMTEAGARRLERSERQQLYERTVQERERQGYERGAAREKSLNDRGSGRSR